MRPPSRPQSTLRRPLNTILGSEGNVRVLRELARHGGELGAADIAARAGLSPQHVRGVLAHLAGLALVDELGPGRTRLYRFRTVHPLARPIEALFEAEDDRFAALLSAIREAAAAVRPRPIAVWLYGSTARAEDSPGSDVDVVVVAEEDLVGVVLDQMRELLRSVADELGVELALVGAAPGDVRRADAGDPWWVGVSRDAVPIAGPDPKTLLAGLRAARRGAAA
jgi:predicted nucleotidyltransferase